MSKTRGESTRDTGLKDKPRRWSKEEWRNAVAEAPPFSVALGQKLRTVRERKGWTTEDIATSAQGYGLGWHRTTVGQIELGKRALSAIELLMLPFLYGEPLVKLLPSEVTHLTDTTAANISYLVAFAITGEVWDQPGSGPLHRPGRFHFKGQEERVGRFVQALLDKPNPWPLEAVAAHIATPDEAEMKAAKRLDTTPHYVAYAARMTWGHGLTEERDTRLNRRPDTPADRRALQAARGHVTRELINELNPVIRRLEEQRTPTLSKEI
ncbi:helix-turn-helix transcriptional regulator [Nonomuraea endophytica]|uniref:Transcriptional regulator with XRE-family HTH domain n=1 Tax=Nonomuraea endophytica TaxID=714136 RepID=A0A7W7ZXY1_9ACTN|nr:helix-turn-helix transcriptional regulator [Nonomuraea endophytica]MBB5075838.1 transcriptional regulator with XRE-family HTH domain [Nonomuraea endophytica]